MTKTIALPIYTGSVKSLYPITEDLLRFEFSDDYSVFDWGKMPDTLSQKGNSLALLGGYLFQQFSQPAFWQTLPEKLTCLNLNPDALKPILNHAVFEQLQATGLRHHFKGWWMNDQIETDWEIVSTASLNQRIGMIVEPVVINRPQWDAVKNQYHYDCTDQRPVLLPLEVVFRFGMPQGSSLQKRLLESPEYAKTLGLSEADLNNPRGFQKPIIDFFTKLEPQGDRFLTREEAQAISFLSDSQFEDLEILTKALALAMAGLSQAAGLTLWDGKFEFALTESGLMLVDSIGPDELRLTVDDVSLSKEALRQIYHLTGWGEAVAQAKAKTHAGEDWREHCPPPARLSVEAKSVFDALYPSLTVAFTQASNLLAHAKPLPELISELRQLFSQTEAVV